MKKSMLKVSDLVKQYDGVMAVDHLSFDVNEGEVFGLLGPNGAGKTTTIRIIMDIFAPDAGVVSVLDQPPGKARSRLGYLPEERGLYRDLEIVEVLTYMAELKGTASPVAHQRTLDWLEKVELSDWVGRRVKDLSRGMQQKLQFVASLIHDPEMLILDEPFAGLDPINVDLIKKLIEQLRQEGKTVVLSAHQMNLVEALCDRIVLINKGRAILYGSLDEVKERYALHTVRIQTPDADKLESLPGVAKVEQRDGQSFLLTLANISPQELLKAMVERGVSVRNFEVAGVPLEEIFIAAVKEGMGEKNG